MRKKHDDIIIYFDDNGENKGGHSHVVSMIFAILAFVAIFIPMFGSTLRYQTSYIFQEIFNTIGSFSKLAGMLLLAYGFLGIFIKKRIGVEALIFGVLLLWIGAFLTYTPFTLFGITIGDAIPPIGYH